MQYQRDDVAIYLKRLSRTVEQTQEVKAEEQSESSPYVLVTNGRCCTITSKRVLYHRAEVSFRLKSIAYRHETVAANSFSILFQVIVD